MTNKLTTLILFLLAVSVPAGAGAEYRFTGAERIVALSDPHGAYDAMVTTLANAGVIDGDRNWAGGATHLVITGDLLDRGADSRPIMDLVMQLEAQAVEAGGQVHLTLGNHEVMNLVGDLRYVAPTANTPRSRMMSRPKSVSDGFRSTARAVGRPRQQRALSTSLLLRVEFDNAIGHPVSTAIAAAFQKRPGRYGRWLLAKTAHGCGQQIPRSCTVACRRSLPSLALTR